MNLVQFHNWDVNSDISYVITPKMECRFGLEEGVYSCPRGPRAQAYNFFDYRCDYYDGYCYHDNCKGQNTSHIREDLGDNYLGDNYHIKEEGDNYLGDNYIDFDDLGIPHVNEDNEPITGVQLICSCQQDSNSICLNIIDDYKGDDLCAQHYIRLFFDKNNENNNIFLQKCKEFENVKGVSIIKYTKHTDGDKNMESEPYLIANVIVRSDKYANQSAELYDENKTQHPMHFNLFGNTTVKTLLHLNFNKRHESSPTWMMIPIARQIVKYYPRMHSNLKHEIVYAVNDMKYKPHGTGYIEAMTEFNSFL